MAAGTIASVVTIVIGLEKNPDAVNEYLGHPSHGPSAIAKLTNLLNSVASGTEKGVVMAFADENDGTESYDYITCVQANASDGDTVTVLGVVLTAKTSGASPRGVDGEFNIGADDDALCDNLFAAINAHPRLRGIVHASEDGGDTNSLYIQYRCAGPFNFGTVTTSAATAFVVENGVMTGGATGTQQVNTRGWECGCHGADPGALTHA